MIRFDWGDLRFTVLDGGTLWLDGGAMFGVVPKVLWERLRSADERNRICLAMNLLLVEDGRSTTLVDTGAGPDWDPKNRNIYRLETKSAEEILAPAGIRPEAVDRVVLSHLHFDHAGGATVRDGHGTWQPAFPNAEYVVQAGELSFARSRNERTRAQYRPEAYEPLVENDRLRLVEGAVTIGALELDPAPGHTPHLQMVRVSTGEGTVAFLSDLVPTASHLSYPYIMGFDVEPLVTLSTKKHVLPRAAAEGWRVVFEHDVDLPLARLVEHDGRFVARPLEMKEG